MIQREGKIFNEDDDEWWNNRGFSTWLAKKTEGEGGKLDPPPHSSDEQEKVVETRKNLCTFYLFRFQIPGKYI